MANSKWIVYVQGVPLLRDFVTTGGFGPPLVCDQTTGQVYYLAAGDIVTPILGGGGSGAILEIDGGDASNSGTPYLTLDGGSA